MQINLVNSQISSSKNIDQVSLNKDQLDNIYNQVIKYFQANASIPGFRKGKVDKKLIERNFADRINMQFEEEAKKKAIENFAENEKVGKITNVSNFIFTNSKEKLTCDIEYYPAPIVPDIFVSDIQINRAMMLEISNENINKFITELFLSIIDKKITNEEEQLNEEVLEKIKNNLDKTLEEKLNILSDDNIQLIFECKREEVENVVKNRIRDEFIVCSNNYLKIQLFNALEKKLDFVLPEYLLENDSDNLDYIKQSLNLESKIFAEKTEEEKDIFMQKYSIRRIKIGLFFASYASQNKIIINNTDISKYLNQLKVSDYMQYFTIMQNPNKYFEIIKNSVIEDKCVDNILSLVKTTDMTIDYFDLVKKLEEIEQVNII